MTIEEDYKKFSEFCSKCNGGCCKGEKDHIIPISRKEAEFLKSKYPELKIELGKFGRGRMRFFRLGGDCYFLGKNGCKLGNDRPVNCKMFPLITLYKDGKIEFYFDDSDHCPYTKEIQKLEEWKKKSLVEIKKEVEKWSEDEKLFFSDLCEGIEKLKKV